MVESGMHLTGHTPFPLMPVLENLLLLSTKIGGIEPMTALGSNRSHLFAHMLNPCFLFYR
jgi:hypothetical protein